MENSKPPYYFPDEIMHQILLDLPVKSLIRFSCVCKSWQNLITCNEAFVQSHINQAIANKSRLVKLFMFSHRTFWVLCYDQFGKPTTADNQVTKVPDPVTFGWKDRFVMVGSCDGVICFYVSSYYMHFSTIIYLWKPALHQCRTIKTEENLNDSYFMGVYSDPKDQDYKVVKLSSFEISKNQLFSFKNNSWKQIAYYFPHSFRTTRQLLYYSTLEFNGCMHWIAEVSRENAKEYFVLAFDIASEKLTSFPIPSVTLASGMSFKCSGVFDGCLSIITSVDSGWEVWSMSEYGQPNSWMRFAVIPFIPFAYPFGINVSGNILFKNLNVVLAYDHVERKFLKSLELNLSGSAMYDRYHVVDYIENLISIMPPSS